MDKNYNLFAVCVYLLLLIKLSVFFLTFHVPLEVLEWVLLYFLIDREEAGGFQLHFSELFQIFVAVI